MTALSLVAREMRGLSRRPANQWLRVLAAGVLIGVFAYGVLILQADLSAGDDIFGGLGFWLTLALWVLVPVMTADCISREKREGTLGLLFLTPLTVLDVIVAKSAVHALRAFTLFLAAVPVLVLPFLIGGVSWQTVCLTLADQITATLLGLAAGIWASTRGGSVTQVMVRALLMTGLAAFLSYVPVMVMMGGAARSPMPLVSSLFYLAARGGLCLFLCFLLLGRALCRLQRTWQQDAPGQQQPRWVRLFSSSDFWRRVFHWDRAAARDRNPIAWLQEYSWTARLTKWGWCLAILAAELILAGEEILDGNASGWQPVLMLALGLGVAFSAANSFRRERDEGLIEILLVTPISPARLMFGRLWGVFSHFFPAFAVLWVFYVGELVLGWHGRGTQWALFWPDPAAFAAVMVVGVWLSLGRLNFFVAWLLTWLAAVLLPVALVGILKPGDSDGWLVSGGFIAVLQVALCGVAARLLYRSLIQRRFLERRPG